MSSHFEAHFEKGESQKAKESSCISAYIGDDGRFNLYSLMLHDFRFHFITKYSVGTVYYQWSHKNPFVNSM